MANQVSNQTVQVEESDSAIAKPTVNGRQNGQVKQALPADKQTVQQDKGGADAVKAHANGFYNGWMRQALLQQFQRQGVTQSLPVDFNDAISPQRRNGSSSPLLEALAEQIEK